MAHSLSAIALDLAQQPSDEESLLTRTEFMRIDTVIDSRQEPNSTYYD